MWARPAPRCGSPSRFRNKEGRSASQGVVATPRTHHSSYDRHCSTLRHLIRNDRPPPGGRPDGPSGRHPRPPGPPGPASLLAIHVPVAVGDTNGPEDAADFARDHAAWLRGLGLLGACVPSAQTLRRLLWDRGPDLPGSCSLWWRGWRRPARRRRSPGGRKRTTRTRARSRRGLCRRWQVGAPLGRRGPRPAPHAHRLGPAGQRPDDRPGGRTRQGQRTDRHPPTPPRPGAEGPRRLHRRHGLPHGRRQNDCRRGRVVPAGRHGRRVQPAPQPAARLRLPGPHRRRGPRPTRDRGAKARTHRAAHLHHPGRSPRHPGQNRPDQRWEALGCAVRHCITNLPVDTGAARMANLVRGHWRGPSGCENSLHRVLDDTPGRTAAACAPATPPATWRPCGASP